MEALGVLVLAYLVGSLPTGYLVTRLLTGKDLRRHGSGNVGALNTYRVVKGERGDLAGLAAGILVALIDASKAVVSYLVALKFSPNIAFLAPALAILGHNYPVWLGFRGGRGLAALLGLFFFAHYSIFALFLLLQGIVYAFTRRFATGAILALLFTLPIHHFLTGIPSYPGLVLAELPVWTRYREKYVLWRAGKLGVNM